MALKLPKPATGRIARHLVRQVLYVALLTAVLFVMITGLVTWNKGLGEIEERFDEIEKSYSDVIRETLWIDDQDTLEAILIGICRLPGIQFADIHSNTLSICAAGTMPEEKHLIRRIPIEYSYNGKTVVLGELHLVGDTAYITRTTLRATLAAAVSQIFMIVIICILFLFPIYRRVIARLLTITAYTSALSLDSISDPLAVNDGSGPDDELNDLAAAINVMRRNLENAVNGQKEIEFQLKEHRENLEKIVDQRTSSLNSTNEKLQMEIDERKKTETALKKSEANLNRAQQVGRMGSWYLDLDTGRLEWSEEVYRIFDITPRQSLTYDRFVSAIHPDDRRSVASAWNEALKGAPYDAEHRIVLNGIEKWVRETAEVEFDREGKPVRGVGIVQDITERKSMEKEREALIIELRKALENIKTLSGLIPICSSCKKIRDDKGYWNNLESYIERHSDASFSHGLCQECSDRLYGDQAWYINMKKNGKS